MSVVERLNTALQGRYRVERKLGEGGMASVYLAEDVRHERKVALKVLRPELAAVLGAERFLGEIKTTANLQHPHILALFDSGEADGFLYYVMPFVEGETLRDRLEREGQLGVEESVRIAREVADALDYAHRAGVIHRDIKPANILLHDGRPVVADFGIALAVSAAGGGRLTETGLSLGTPHYMSPEQASADRDLTARSDVYSLGCVLYEMLAGQPPHTGSSAQRILVSILTEAPKPVEDLRHTVPAHVAGAVTKAIEKLPADRFASAKGFMDALADPSFAYAAVASPRGTPAPSSRGSAPTGRTGRIGRFAPWVVAAGAAAAAAWGWLADTAAPPSPTMRLTFPVEVEGPWDPGRTVISPDGRWIGIQQENGILLREVDQPGFRRVEDSERSSGLTFSPDGEWMAVVDGGVLSKTRTTGSSPIPLVARGEYAAQTPDWGPGGEIVFVDVASQRLCLVGENGGDVRCFGEDPYRPREPRFLPDGSGILFGDALEGLSLLDLASGRVTVLAEEGIDGTYIDTGHIVYGRSTRGIFAIPFDLKRHRVTGPPVPLVPEVAATANNSYYSVSRTGTLLFWDGGGAERPTVLSLLQPDGSGDTIRLETGRRQQVRFSPDGSRIAFNSGGGVRDAERQVYTYDLAREFLNPLTFERGHRAVWSPDGRFIAYSSERDGTIAEDLWIHPVDGSAAPRPILAMEGDQHAAQWPSDSTLLFEYNGDLFTVNPFADRPVAVGYAETVFEELDLMVAPGGSLAAYVSSETGREEVYVRDFPEPRGKWRVTRDGGSQPRWNEDGSGLYHVDAAGTAIVRVDLDIGPPVSPIRSTTVWEMRRSIESWDFDPATGRAVVSTFEDDRGVEENALQIIVNWFEEVKRLTGGAR